MDSNLELAQATILGVIIGKPERAAEAFSWVHVDDFDQQYRLIAEAVHGLRTNAQNISTLSVIDEMTRRGTIARVGHAEVHRVAGFEFGDLDYSVGIVTRATRLRELAVATTRAGQHLEQEDADPRKVARYLQERAQSVIDMVDAAGEDITTPTLGEFLDVEDAPYDWVIPGLLERGDRLVLTGSEGLGKSVLNRQLAVSTASGVHPFSHRPITPQRVLYVDCENGVVKLRRAMRPLKVQGKAHGQDPSMNLFIETRPEGLDLTRTEDEQWLVKRVSAIQPALLLVGPLYRLHAANPNDEAPARDVARVLDRCRIAANCALIVEAHAGHAFGADKRPVRPTGTSLWLRWPEFGYGLRAQDNYRPERRIVDMVPWRGDREERSWPTTLRSGGAWPWEQDPTIGDGIHATPNYYERQGA